MKKVINFTRVKIIRRNNGFVIRPNNLYTVGDPIKNGGSIVIVMPHVVIKSNCCENEWVVKCSDRQELGVGLEITVNGTSDAKDIAEKIAAYLDREMVHT